MTDSEQQVGPTTEAPAVPPAGPAKGKVTKKAATAPKSKKPSEPAGDKKVPAHPPTSQLVTEAIRKLNERGGSSLIAIKKSIADSHELDVEKLAPLIRKFLKSGVQKGTLVQTKGTGATGSFKLAQKEKKVKEPAAVAEKKPKASKAPGVVKVKKPPAAGMKKAAVKPKGAQKPAALKAKTVKPVKAKGPAKPKASKPAKVAEPEAAVEKSKAPAAEKKPKAPAAEEKPKPSKAVKVKAASSKKTKAPAKPRATRKAATAAPSI